MSKDKMSKIEKRQNIERQNVERQNVEITKRSKDPKDRNFPEILQLQLATGNEKRKIAGNKKKKNCMKSSFAFLQL
jgi:hypothetical protein